MYNITLVSAFLTNINSHRSVEKYIEYGEKLMNIRLPKVIFIEKYIYDLYYTKYNSDDLTKFVFITKEDLFLQKFRNKINVFHKYINSKKDTLEYIMVQCNKTDWVKQAIELNYYDTSQYAWLDFGIYHMYGDTKKDKFIEHVEKMNNSSYKCVRAANAREWMQWTDYLYIYKIFEEITWVFSGSVFGGDCNSLLKFDTLMKEKCELIINIMQTITWEVNIWLILYSQNKELFDLYKGDHDDTILENY
jgi:hypothetical protein